MSKMTIIYEREKKMSPSYTDHTYEEFLEMIGRIAFIKFQGSEMDQLDLTTKIEYVLDDLFQLIEVDRLEKEEDEDLCENEEETEDDY